MSGILGILFLLFLLSLLPSGSGGSGRRERRRGAAWSRGKEWGKRIASKRAGSKGGAKR